MSSITSFSFHYSLLIPFYKVVLGNEIKQCPFKRQLSWAHKQIGKDPNQYTKNGSWDPYQ